MNIVHTKPKARIGSYISNRFGVAIVVKAHAGLHDILYIEADSGGTITADTAPIFHGRISLKPGDFFVDKRSLEPFLLRQGVYVSLFTGKAKKSSRGLEISAFRLTLNVEFGRVV